MHPSDQDSTSFITGQGTFCYKAMPFGLKNADAAYQRLVNRMFADQLGTTMKVYIDDMLVKSLKSGDHIDRLRQAFQVLEQYGMKVNPAKCYFRVSSRKVIGFLIITKRGVEANPNQIRSVREIR